jgi:hypothetical protein
MATVVIGGLIFSTLLTLIVIPVVYTLLDDLTAWLKRLLLPRNLLLAVRLFLLFAQFLVALGQVVNHLEKLFHLQALPVLFVFRPAG